MTVDTLMWGSDYPHTDGIWPEVDEVYADQFVGCRLRISRITCETRRSL